MKNPALTVWDSATHLRTPEDRAAYLDACLTEAGDDPLFIAKALGNIARSAAALGIRFRAEPIPEG